MTFNYIIEDINGNVADEIDYEVDGSILGEAFYKVLENYSKEELINFVIEEFNIYDFYDELKDYFEEEALRCRKNNQ